MAGRREEILAAALEVVVAESVQGLTLAKLFSAAKTGPGTFYHYFQDKDALIKELYTYCAEREDALLVRCKDTSLSSQERLDAAVVEILRSYESIPNETGFVRWYCNNGVEGAFASAKRNPPSVEVLRDIMAQAQSEGLATKKGSALLLARVVRSFISSVYWGCKHGECAPVDEIAPHLAQRIWLMIG